MLNYAEENFIKQSYLDAVNDYETSKLNPRIDHWDWVIISAANQMQATSFQMQLELRRKLKMLPQKTKFAIVPDVDGKRIGSGGATLNIFKYLYEEEGEDALLNSKVLVLHSGGDSKRLPQYSATGKLFAPVPRQLTNGRRATIFDELLIIAAPIPARIGNGIFIMPSDTLIYFNAVQLDLCTCDAAGLSMKTNIATGKEHGVFISDQNGKVSHFLHKQSEEELLNAGAMDTNGEVNVDTGCTWLSSKVVQKIFSLICDEFGFNQKRFEKYVNEKVCLSFYADFLFPLANKATIEAYMSEIPENVFSEELTNCRAQIWKKIHPFQMDLIKLRPSKYVHLGTLQDFSEILIRKEAEYDFLGWDRNIISNVQNQQGIIISNCFFDKSVSIKGKAYLEDSNIGENTIIGANTILSNIDIRDKTIPDNVVLHGLKLKNKKYVYRILGVSDNPKNSIDGKFLASSIRKILNEGNLKKTDICNESLVTIWNAELFPECDTREKAIEMALILYRITEGSATSDEINTWKYMKKHSLKSSFNEADTEDLLKRQTLLTQKIKTENFISYINEGVPFNIALNEVENNETLICNPHLILKKASSYMFPLNMRLYYSLSMISKKYNRTIGGKTAMELEDMAYETVKDVITSSVKNRYSFVCKGFKRESVAVSLPVRVNFCGSPSDAAPYCLEYGGTMLNAALLLNGKMPIEAKVKRMEESVIVFESLDQKIRKEITEIKEIQNCANPFDPFALHKAALLAVGIIPDKENTEQTITSITKELGGGIYLGTCANVPKGSGLGTSSILAAACVKALNESLEQDVNDEKVVSQVFAVEQFMNTGGGWQDQAGAITPGIKLIKTKPGHYQKLEFEKVHLEPSVCHELQNRFALVFSGQRRLARNVLRAELNRCIENDENTMRMIDRIRSLCFLMKFELEKGNITCFAKYIKEQFELLKKIDRGVSNTYIDYIFTACNDLIDGYSICGAGGGGFLQMILKKGVSKEMLQQRLKTEFSDSGVALWDSELI